MTRRRHSKDRGAPGRSASPLSAAVSPAASPSGFPSTLPPWPPLPAAVYGGSSTKRGAGVGAFLLAIVTAGALAHVGVRIKGLQVAYDLGSERRITTELEEQRRRLQIEIGMLKDPGRVIAIARDKLRMGPPESESIWRLGSDGAPRSGGPPSGTSATSKATQTAGPTGTRPGSTATGAARAGASTTGTARGGASKTAKGTR